jgi:hypothetical protein
VGHQHGVDEGGVHPAQELAVTTAVRRPAGHRAGAVAAPEPPLDSGVQAVDVTAGAASLGGGAEADHGHPLNGAPEAAVRVAGVGAVLDRAGGDEWVRRLHEQGATGSEHEHRLGHDPPGDRARTEQPGVGRRIASGEGALRGWHQSADGRPEIGGPGDAHHRPIIRSLVV